MEPTLKLNSPTNANADEFLVICSNSGLIGRPLCGITTETACVDDWKLLGFLTGQKRRVLHRLNRSVGGRNTQQHSITNLPGLYLDTRHTERRKAASVTWRELLCFRSDPSVKEAPKKNFSIICQSFRYFFGRQKMHHADYRL